MYFCWKNSGTAPSEFYGKMLVPGILVSFSVYWQHVMQNILAEDWGIKASATYWQNTLGQENLRYGHVTGTKRLDIVLQYLSAKGNLDLSKRL
jgi:hypothetical protein